MLGRWRTLAGGVGAIALLGLYSLWRFGIDGFGLNGGRLGWPIVAYVERPSIAGWVLAAVAITTLVIGVRLRDWSWVMAALFILSFGTDVTRDPVNAWRAAGLLPVLWAFGPGYEGRGTSPVTVNGTG